MFDQGHMNARWPSSIDGQLENRGRRRNNALWRTGKAEPGEVWNGLVGQLKYVQP